MSEVQDACQVLMMTGQGAYLLGKISVRSAAMVLKVMNTIYLSKWKGSVSLKRFRQIKGDDFLFVNAGTEERSDLRKMERELQDHGVLFARLPDLCGGDGRTQYVVSAADASKFKAFLIDHNGGKYKHIKVGPITVEDYTRSGFDMDGNERPELQALNQSAKEGLEENNIKGNPNKVREQTDVDKDLKLSKSRTEKNGKSKKPEGEITPAVRYGLMRHDQNVLGREDTEWITDAPIMSSEFWQMYEFPDGVHSVIVPKADYFEIPSDKGTEHRTALHKDKTYTVLDMNSRILISQSGGQVAESMNHLDYRTENTQLKNLLKNRKEKPDRFQNLEYENSSKFQSQSPISKGSELKASRSKR